MTKKRKRPEPYMQIVEGEWIEPSKRGFVLACCGCDLVHVNDYYADDAGRIYFRTRVDRRLTAAARRANKGKGNG
jgi:hypothetical protein